MIFCSSSELFVVVPSVLCMFSAKGESYLARLGGKARLKRVVPSSLSPSSSLSQTSLSTDGQDIKSPGPLDISLPPTYLSLSRTDGFPGSVVASADGIPGLSSFGVFSVNGFPGRHLGTALADGFPGLSSPSSALVDGFPDLSTNSTRADGLPGLSTHSSALADGFPGLCTHTVNGLPDRCTQAGTVLSLTALNTMDGSSADPGQGQSAPGPSGDPQTGQDQSCSSLGSAQPPSSLGGSGSSESASAPGSTAPGATGGLDVSLITRLVLQQLTGQQTGQSQLLLSVPTQMGQSQLPPSVPTQLAATGAHTLIPALSMGLGPQPSVDQSGSDEDEEGEGEEPSSAGQAFSFTEALLALTSSLPVVAGEAAIAPELGLSASEKALGSSSAISSPGLRLKESEMVTGAIRKAHCLAQGVDSPPAASAGSLLDFPGALSSGKFIRPHKFPFPRKPPVCHDAIPKATLTPSPEDLLLLQDKARSARSVQIQDKILAEWEESTRRNLEVISVVDSFLGGLINAVRDPDHPGEGFHLREEIEPDQVFVFAKTALQGLRSLSDSVAKLHTNFILARRDAVLSHTQVAFSASQKASLRVAPVSDGSLFAGQVQAALKQHAQVCRDLALSNPTSNPAGRAFKRPAQAMSGPAPQAKSAKHSPRPRFRPATRVRPGPGQGRGRGRGKGGQASPRPAHPQ